jgi:hypothetical protein
MTVIGYLVLFQPVMGLLQHRHYKRTHQRSFYGFLHCWLGRTILALAIINGGLGFRFSGIGTVGVPRGAMIAYSIVAGVVGALYITVILFGKKIKPSRPENEPFMSREGMELKSKNTGGHDQQQMSRDPNARYDPVPEHS